MSVFDVLAEPNRRRILDLLAAAERPVGEIVQHLGLSQPAVSKHLRVLRDAGLVEVRGDAQRRLYRVRAEPLRAVDDWLVPYRRMWAARLDDLERHLDVMDDTDSQEGGADVRDTPAARRRPMAAPIHPHSSPLPGEGVAGDHRG